MSFNRFSTTSEIPATESEKQDVSFPPPRVSLEEHFEKKRRSPRVEKTTTTRPIFTNSSMNGATQKSKPNHSTQERWLGWQFHSSIKQLEWLRELCTSIQPTQSSSLISDKLWQFALVRE